MKMNKIVNAMNRKMREQRVEDGYYDGRFATKSVPNKRLEFLSDCDVEYDEYLLDDRKVEEITPSPHRL